MTNLRHLSTDGARRRAPWRVRTAHTLLAAMLGCALVAGGAYAADVSPGLDYWMTSPGTYVDFGPPTPALPADFFGPGSDPFEGQIALRGELLGLASGAASTIIERLWPALDDGSGEDTIPIQLVELSLVSTEPIIVSFNGGMELVPYDVRVDVSHPNPSVGHMTILFDGADLGGWYHGYIELFAHFTFTPQEGPYGEVEWLSEWPYMLEAPGPYFWMHDPPWNWPADCPTFGGPNFYPMDPGMLDVILWSPWAIAGRHPVQPLVSCCVPSTMQCLDLLDPTMCTQMGGTEMNGPCAGKYRACCMGGSGQCVMVDPVCCPVFGGVEQGPGTQCQGDQACCDTDDSCQVVDGICCDDMPPGTSQAAGPGTDCSDSDGSGLADDCECNFDGTCDRPVESECNCPGDCGSPAQSEVASSTCTDGLDNDCDGPIDCDDHPDCDADPACQATEFYPKWSQPLDDPAVNFDAASDLAWPNPNKWEQLPDETTSGLHAHGPNPTITLADDFICQGGDIYDLHWWGNYENNDPGNGIIAFILSLHTSDLIDPCLPGPEIWSMPVQFADTNETDSGLTNNMGETIYYYSYILQTPQPQIQGQTYWLAIRAMTNPGPNPVVWRWQEAGRNPTPIGCSAAERIDLMPWHTIEWPGDPVRYSDMAFRITSLPEAEVNKVMADDFISDGRPIERIRWWGSYIDPDYEPHMATDPYSLDGWLITFHWADANVAPICPPDLAVDPPPTALGVYFVSRWEVHTEVLGISDCLGHPIYEYEIDLIRCCLVCSELDPRGLGNHQPAMPGVFFEERGYRYWVSIQAVTGVEWSSPPADCSAYPTGNLPSPNTADGHFWGWHTTEDVPVLPDRQPSLLSGACTGEIADFTPYPADCWDYGQWDVLTHECLLGPFPDEINMAYELMTQEPPQPCTEDVDCYDGDVCNWDRCVDGICQYLPNRFGDVDHNGTISIFDVFCILNAFGGQFPECTVEDCDIAGASMPANCGGDGTISVFDLFAVLNAFGGADPCCYGLP